jgi:hypothetical protein
MNQENSLYPTAFLNASGGKVSASFSQWWRIVFQLTALLTVSLTVAVHQFKKPCIYNGFNNLNTDGHGLTRIKFFGDATLKNTPGEITGAPVSDPACFRENELCTGSETGAPDLQLRINKNCRWCGCLL